MNTDSCGRCMSWVSLSQNTREREKFLFSLREFFDDWRTRVERQEVREDQASMTWKAERKRERLTSLMSRDSQCLYFRLPRTLCDAAKKKGICQSIDDDMALEEKRRKRATFIHQSLKKWMREWEPKSTSETRSHFCCCDSTHGCSHAK